MNLQEAAMSLGISVKTLRAHPRRKQALLMLVSKSEQEERAA
jgi:DNA-binding CsgD family transcriptional regulator